MGPQEEGRGKALPRWFREGAGRLAPGGKGPLGEVPKIPTPVVRAPSLGHQKAKSPSSGPQVLARLPRSLPTREATLARLQGGRSARASLLQLVETLGSGDETHPSVCPQSPRGRPDPPPRYLTSRVLAGGCCTKRRWSRETPNR